MDICDYLQSLARAQFQNKRLRYDEIIRVFQVQKVVFYRFNALHFVLILQLDEEENIFVSGLKSAIP